MLNRFSTAAALFLTFISGALAHDIENPPPVVLGKAHEDESRLTATVVGSGSLKANADRAGPSVLIRYGGTDILIDTDNGTQANLGKLGLAVDDLDGLFFTHHHLNHNGEFVPIFIRSLLKEHPLSLVGPSSMTAMTVSTIRQYREDIDYQLSRFGRSLDGVLETYDIREIDGGERMTVGGIDVTTTPVNHTIEAVAYRFDAGDQSIVISGDLSYSETLSELAKDSDVLIIDSGAQERATDVQGTDSDRHATASVADIARMAGEADPGQLVLTHFNGSASDQQAMLAELRKVYDGPVMFAEELAEVSAETAGRDVAIVRATSPAELSGAAPSNPCSVTPAFENAVTISEESDTRHIAANAIPAHKIGTFPNPGNPNRVAEQDKSYTIPLSPEVESELTYVYDGGIDRGRPSYVWGVALNGVKIEPSANEFFQGQGGPNTEWTVEALSDEIFLGEDCNNAHVQPNGEYHYHGSPTGLIDQMIDGDEPTSMVLAGWAADGFPIYYRWGPQDADDIESGLIELQPSYELRGGERPGDGVTEPDGHYSGKYVRDYAYVEGQGDLDACNGRSGVTPEFPDGTYYYVLTESFPFAGRCLVGVPSDDFKIGGGLAGGPGGPQAREGHRHRPDPAEIMGQLDRSGDGMIDPSEARGPLSDNFEQHDRNGDGMIAIDELGPPQP